MTSVTEKLLWSVVDHYSTLNHKFYCPEHTPSNMEYLVILDDNDSLYYYVFEAKVKILQCSEPGCSNTFNWKKIQDDPSSDGIDAV